jgi:hypothetical protein
MSKREQAEQQYSEAVEKLKINPNDREALIEQVYAQFYLIESNLFGSIFNNQIKTLDKMTDILTSDSETKQDEMFQARIEGLRDTASDIRKQPR